MKFNRSLDWFKESDDDELLGNDELDLAKPDEEMNEGLYVDPSNYDKHNDLVDVVDKAGNPQKMTQATYDKNKDSGEFEKKEPEEKEVKAGKKVDSRDLKEGNSYVTKEDMYYGDVEEFDGIYDIDELKKKGFVKGNEVVIPAGSKLNYEGFNGGAYTFDINGEEFDLSLDDVDLYETEEQKLINKGFNKDFANDIKKKYGEDDYKTMVALAAQNDAELYPDNTAYLIKQDTNISDEDINKFIQMYTYDDHDNWKA